MKSILSVVLPGLLIAWDAHGAKFGGIEFPQGSLSFADAVVSYTPGNPGPTHPDFIDPSDALGVPDYPGGEREPGSVSLGRGGSIVLEFTNNALTGSNDASHDLHIFEVGSQVEDTFVEVSADGVTWKVVGKVFGSTSSIDIDGFGFTSADTLRFVRLTDDPNEGGASGDTVGADIDAVGAINTSQVADKPPLVVEAAIVVKFQTALGSKYTIEESTDLENWSDGTSDIVGNGGVMKLFFETTTSRKYYRLKPAVE